MQVNTKESLLSVKIVILLTLNKYDVAKKNLQIMKFCLINLQMLLICEFTCLTRVPPSGQLL